MLARRGRWGRSAVMLGLQLRGYACPQRGEKTGHELVEVPSNFCDFGDRVPLAKWVLGGSTTKCV